MTNCPKCKSKDIEKYRFSGSLVLKCNSCGYDEGLEFDQNTSEKANQKAKGNYSPYKTGGSRRANQ